MARFLKTLALTILLLAGLDLSVAGALRVAESRGMMTSLVRFFDYGRSVPGKHAVWQNTLGSVDNPMEASWIDGVLTGPLFFEGATDDPSALTIRSYGMSFSANIFRAAVKMDPSLTWDAHVAPAASPNFVYYANQLDRPNRDAGDIVVLSFLSSSVPGMASLSNRTWNPEQPMPFTYPIYRAVNGQLQTTQPIVTSLEDELNPAFRESWNRQLRTEDANYLPMAFAWPALDRSPFFRLIRRAFTSRQQTKAKQAILKPESFPIAETLQLMALKFAQDARKDGQLPILFLIQGRDAGDVQLLELLKPVLDANNIAYLATVELVDPTNPANFRSDGHYQFIKDDIFAEAFLDLIKDWPRRP